MQKRTREIIALVLLTVLLIVGVGAAAWYIFVGHNWNEAATNIDDRIGSMDGYTIVLCEGSMPTPAAQYAASISASMLEEQNFGSDAVEDPASAEPMTIVEAIESYTEKEAQVVIVHMDDPKRYADPVIVVRNGRRIALFSVDGPRSDLAARIISKSVVEKYKVDFTICIIDDLDDVKRGLGSVDLALCTDYDDAGSDGRYIGTTYVMGTPFGGQVGAVIIAPSGYLSSKMVEVS